MTRHLIRAHKIRRSRPLKFCNKKFFCPGHKNRRSFC